MPQLVKLTTNWNYVMTVDSTFANGSFILSPLLNLRHLNLRYFNRYGK